MSRRYIIGVDGGNSKTDYFLFDVDGSFVDHMNTGTCSHERFADGYVSTERIMGDNIRELLGRHGLSLEDVAAGAFGLAGADIPSQKVELSRIVERIGFMNYAVDNDSFLGVKAGLAKGYGICSINGSGTVTGGISPSGQRLQVGGVGSELAGDEAGGFYLARKVIRTVYDAYYRMGPQTSMSSKVMELLQIPSKELFLERAWEGILSGTLPYTPLIQLLFAAADEGDEAALAVIDHSAKQLALSTAGCIRSLDFSGDVDIVLAGSVWVKVESPALVDRYQAYVGELLAGSGLTCSYLMLQVPPATGAVLWALELAHGRPVDAAMRSQVIQRVEQLQG
ncbi:BadF/BadG/BcrA/BcrD ATPase family protein [Paenibacillus sp. GCM10023252]|uniref:BadF/BadG/BcrA/BcrD ATPase family protein n=1 Tax=Paenibacillus sp. GCM10023252 TaxID=3252649 RepID=UPI003621CD16